MNFNHLEWLVASADRNLDVLGARLDDFEEGTNTQLDTGIVRVGRLVRVVLLQELSDCVGAAADGVRLPLVVGAARVGLVQVRGAVIVEADNDRRQAEWTSTTALGVFLNKPGFNYGVFPIKP